MQRGNLMNRDEQVYEYIVNYIGEHQYSPTFDEIAKNFQIRSKSSVFEIIGRLEQSRKITVARDSNGNRLARTIVVIGE